MFGFFKKTPKIDRVADCSDLARSCEIDSFLELGFYKGFLIHLPISIDEFRKRCTDHSALTAFTRVVEERINAGDFDDLRPNYELLGIPRPTHDHGKSSALRAVFDNEKNVIFRWGGESAESEQAAPPTKVDEFTLSSFQIRIETNPEKEVYVLKAKDTRTNSEAFQSRLETSPAGRFLVHVGADGSRQNHGAVHHGYAAEDFLEWAIGNAIETIYSSQLLTDAEAHYFAINVVADHLNKVGFQLLTRAKDPLQDPQLYAMKDGRTVAVLVRCKPFPGKGTIDRSSEEFYQLLSNSLEKGIEVYFASVGLANANAANDYERRALLRNGSFHVAFSGLEKLS